MTTSTFEANFADQADIFNPDQFVDTVTVIGVGGIGASALPTLVTMGIRRFVLWDPDVVEDRNIASQLLFKPSDLYRSKVEVAREYLLAYGATEVEIHQELFTADSPVEGIVISGVDSMAARKIIWEAVSKNLDTVELLLDGRIGGEFMQLFAVDPMNSDWYTEKWLFGKKQEARLACTQRAIVYPAVALGAFMASRLAKFLRGETLERRIDLHLNDLFFQTVG